MHETYLIHNKKNGTSNFNYKSWSGILSSIVTRNVTMFHINKYMEIERFELNGDLLSSSPSKIEPLLVALRQKPNIHQVQPLNLSLHGLCTLFQMFCLYLAKSSPFSFSKWESNKCISLLWILFCLSGENWRFKTFEFGITCFLIKLRYVIS